MGQNQGLVSDFLTWNTLYLNLFYILFFIFSDAITYPDPDPLISQSSLEYYGQRPWRPGKISIEPPDMELEQKGISALLFRERNLKPTHSEVIVDLFRKAIEHYKIFRSPRAESNLVVQMAEELVISQR